MIEHVERSRELEEAFDVFTRVADRLQSAYHGLKGTAAQLDRELTEANARLQTQVEQLENLSGSLAAVLRAIPCGVVVAGRDGQILMANPAAETILGRPAANLVGRAARDVQDAAGAPVLLLVDGPTLGGERRVETAAGETRLVEGCVVPVTDAAGDELGLVEVLTDRSELRALELEVKRLDRLAELGQVAAILAHEIRNPLSGIRGFAGMLERSLGENGSESQRRWTRRICEGVVRTDAIIDGVLFLARPRPLRREQVEAQAFLCDVFELVAQADPARARNVHVTVDAEPRGLTFSGDRLRLQQALTNLVHNALEALDGKGRLVLAARTRLGRLELSVADSGPGVAADVADRLFEPFFTTKTEGAGLGLALVQRIAEMHGGRVELRQGLGSGAAFVLSLPADALLQEAAAR